MELLEHVIRGSAMGQVAADRKMTVLSTLTNGWRAAPGGTHLRPSLQQPLGKATSGCGSGNWHEPVRTLRPCRRSPRRSGRRTLSGSAPAGWPVPPRDPAPPAPAQQSDSSYASVTPASAIVMARSAEHPQEQAICLMLSSIAACDGQGRASRCKALVCGWGCARPTTAGCQHLGPVVVRHEQRLHAAVHIHPHMRLPAGRQRPQHLRLGFTAGGRSLNSGPDIARPSIRSRSECCPSPHSRDAITKCLG